MKSFNNFKNHYANTMKFNALLCIGLVLSIGFTSHGQNPKADSLKVELQKSINLKDSIKLLHQLHGALVNSHPDSAFRFSKTAFESSQLLNDPKLHGQSYFNMGHVLFVTGQLDEFKALLLEAIPYLVQTGQGERIAGIYRNLAVYGEVTGQPDSSLFYLDKCLHTLQMYPDSSILGDAYLSKGFAYRVKGFQNLSIESLLNALRIFEKVGTPNQNAYAFLNLGISYALSERKEKAIEASVKAGKLFLQENNLRAYAQIKNNLGHLYGEMDHVEKSGIAHRESIQYSKQTQQLDVLANNYWNLSRLNFRQNRMDSAIYWLSLTEETAEKIRDSFLLGGVHRYRSQVALKNNNSRSTRIELTSSLVYLKEYYDPLYTEEAHQELSEIYEQLGNYEQALVHWKMANSIKDSLYTTKRDQQIEELSLIYETEKKDAEILLLNKSNELVKAKNKSLWIGLGLLVLLGGFIVYHLVQKRKREQKILIQENKIEIEKRRVIEKELEYKKRELTAKALQLARKNEFLNQLGSEVKELHSQLDVTVNKTSNRISRMIQRATESSSEWEDFAKQFSSIHQSFIDTLIKRHGSLSKTDLRISSLIKMNLTSKDIASVLNISSEGIKKARYRLRKKLDLKSDVGLQEYLLSIE